MNYIGIDIDKKYSVACVQDEAGQVIKRVRIEGNSAEGFRLDLLRNEKPLFLDGDGTLSTSLEPTREED